jgi:hypothetical protein
MEHQDNEPSPYEADGFSLADLSRVLKEYGTVIRLVMLAIAVGFVIAAAAAYVLLPAERSSSLKVRLTFRGADVAEYPNGTTFTSTEIISPAVLAKVYLQNGLSRFLDFAEFKSSIYILQQNDELDALASEYKARLADPKLTPVDRARIEQEFLEKKKSLSKADLSVVLVSRERLRKLPVATRAKILNDVLSTWAEQTVADKGILLYDVSIFSSGVFSDISSNADYLVTVDLLRTKIGQVQHNIDQLLELPGAKVLRTRSSKRSLAEVRSGFDDMRTYRIQPLIGMLVRNGITRDPVQSTEFLRTAITFSDLRVNEAQARLSAVRDALERYRQQRQPQTAEALPAGTSNSVMDASFLDRILALSVEDTDLEFRQKLVDEYRMEALKVVPLEAESRYYTNLQETFQTRRGPTDAEAARLTTELQAIVADSRRMTDEVNEIYAALSEALNPSTALYVMNEPVRHSTERPVSAMTYVLVGVLLLFAAFPVVVLACVIHARFFAGTSEDASAQSTTAEVPAAEPLRERAG